MLADQLDEAVSGAALGVAFGIGLDVSEITNMAFRICRPTMGLAMGVV